MISFSNWNTYYIKHNRLSHVGYILVMYFLPYLKQITYQLFYNITTNNCLFSFNLWNKTCHRWCRDINICRQFCKWLSWAEMKHGAYCLCGCQYIYLCLQIGIELPCVHFEVVAKWFYSLQAKWTSLSCVMWTWCLPSTANNAMFENWRLFG